MLHSWVVMWEIARLLVEGNGVRNHLLLFQNLSNFIHPTLPLSFGRDTKAVGPFYLVSMPGEEKDPTQGINVEPVLDSIFHDLLQKHP